MIISKLFSEKAIGFIFLLITLFILSFYSDLSFNNLQSLPDNVFDKLDKLDIL